MQLGLKLRYLAKWTCTITCGFLLFCGALL